MQYPRKTLELIQKEYNFIRIDELEKVVRLMDILKMINEDKYLFNTLVLKGGTAINLLWLKLPRLSVDIDLNYIGEVSTERMLEQKKKVQAKLKAIFRRLGYTVISRNENRHAGCNYDLSFINSNSGKSKIKVDISFMHRTPIYGVVEKTPLLEISDNNTPVNIKTLSLNELFASKLKALCQRGTPRDYFDVYMLSSYKELDLSLVKKAFIFFATIDIDNFNNYKLSNIPEVTQSEIDRELLPMLKKNNPLDIKEMLDATKPILNGLFKFTKEEKEFISIFYKKNALIPELLFQNKDFDFLKDYPLANWKLKKLAMNKSKIEITLDKIIPNGDRHEYHYLFKALNTTDRKTGRVKIYLANLILQGRIDRKSTRLNSSHGTLSRMPSSA